MDYKDLLKKAEAAREFAYAPYSKFKVGAALLTKDNLIFTGCNVENAAYGSTMCAERVCVYKAVSQGSRKFIAIAIHAGSHSATPCGECRQVLAEFGADIQVIMGGSSGFTVKSIVELLPCSFTLRTNEKKD
ncbi:cytidine deaminase [Candidatus Contubernalis alkaliaceticus]|uniref:cytidine deaminase n=1 Tax=Candidatus Contubernalis alkaliaceticus TaxID=338645 RepID=UPI001F4C1742|nr:cytidine deaminase [Candidatus Contubernalis alkalaceticus]UNC93124.1 cytidine deaminase [Candidatus Contubernalis alkalaceticus]